MRLQINQTKILELLKKFLIILSAYYTIYFLKKKTIDTMNLFGQDRNQFQEG